MILNFDTLNQDTKTFLDPVKTLGDLGVKLTKKDIEDANGGPLAATAKDETVDAGVDQVL